MFCTQCGKEIRDDAIFCQFCGRTAAPQTPVPKKNMRPAIVIVSAAVTVVALSVVLGIVFFSSSPARRLQQQLDLGNRYLSEQDYEQAIAAYEAALEIDPKSTEAYIALIDIHATRGQEEDLYQIYTLAAAQLGTEELAPVSEKTKAVLESLLDERMAAGDYEGVLVLCGKWKSLLSGIDFDNHIARANQGIRDALIPEEEENTASAWPGGVLPEQGDIITFGSYEQDGNTENGKEPIEWEVLDAEGDEILVVSRYVLDCVKYNEEWEDVTWETCTLRNWMNNAFYTEAFTAEERERIVESNLINSDNVHYGTEGGNDTRDKVFCLSVDEIREYYTFNSWYDDYMYGYSEQLITAATPYAANSGLWTYKIDESYYNDYLKEEGYSEQCIGKEGAVWWLRSPGYRTLSTCGVYGDGDAGLYYDDRVAHASVGVRPALRLKR